MDELGATELSSCKKFYNFQTIRKGMNQTDSYLFVNAEYGLPVYWSPLPGK
ncbi:hypothetical protein GCM10009001_13610 [Virgibacillus siamensis]|uniref:Uncharacterized protein n=1 Tax=Virgibacillus siamensis TaxID=480071 RepID=A0ABP3QWF5_9BACI